MFKENSEDKLKLTSLELRTSNICNLKCRMCHSACSSKVAQEYKSLSQFFREKVSDKSQLRNVSANIDHLLPSLESLQVLRLAGGEPFLDNELLYFCKKLISKGLSSSICIVVTSNFTRISQEWKEILSQFKAQEFLISLDSTGSLIEYVRHGTIWEEMDTNIREMMHFFPMATWVFVPCVNIYSVFGLAEVYEYVETIKQEFSQNIISVVPNMLMHPNYLSVQILSTSDRGQLADQLKDKVNIFKLGKVEAYHFKGFLHRLIQSPSLKAEALTKWRLFNNELDQVRGECVENIVPELKKIPLMG